MSNAKKDFKFTSEGRLITIKWVGGGEIPKELSGLYTSLHEAKQAANDYLIKRDTKPNAKNVSREK